MYVVLFVAKVRIDEVFYGRGLSMPARSMQERIGDGLWFHVLVEASAYGVPWFVDCYPSIRSSSPYRGIRHGETEQRDDLHSQRETVQKAGYFMCLNVCCRG